MQYESGSAMNQLTELEYHKLISLMSSRNIDAICQGILSITKLKDRLLAYTEEQMHDWYQMRAWTEKFNQDNDVAIDLSVRRAKSDDNQIYHNHSGSHTNYHGLNEVHAMDDMSPPVGYDPRFLTHAIGGLKDLQTDECEFSVIRTEYGKHENPIKESNTKEVKSSTSDRSYTYPSEATKKAGPDFPSKRRVSCTICNRVVRADNLKVHMRNHTGEKPYKCPFCPFKSSNPSSLPKHVKLHESGRPIYYCDSCSHSTLFKSNMAAHKKKHHH